MMKNISQARLITLWFALIAVITAGCVVLGIGITVSTGALLLALSLVPPAIVMRFWHRPPPVTVAELLHSVDKPREGRP